MEELTVVEAHVECLLDNAREAALRFPGDVSPGPEDRGYCFQCYLVKQANPGPQYHHCPPTPNAAEGGKE